MEDELCTGWQDVIRTLSLLQGLCRFTGSLTSPDLWSNSSSLVALLEPDYRARAEAGRPVRRLLQMSVTEDGRLVTRMVAVEESKHGQVLEIRCISRGRAGPDLRTDETCSVREGE